MNNNYINPCRQSTVSAPLDSLSASDSLRPWHYINLLTYFNMSKLPQLNSHGLPQVSGSGSCCNGFHLSLFTSLSLCYVADDKFAPPVEGGRHH